MFFIVFILNIIFNAYWVAYLDFEVGRQGKRDWKEKIDYWKEFQVEDLIQNVR